MDARKYYDKLGLLGVKDSDFERFNDVFKYLPYSKNLIDVGCGEGEWLKYLDGCCDISLFGLDVSEVRLSFAKKLVPDIPFFVSNINFLSFKDNSFEQSTALEVLEHIPDWKKGLDELVRISSHVITVTVPYKERLKYEKCENCNENAYLYGHLHSFKERDFLYLEKIYKVNYQKIKNPRDFEYYVKRVFEGLKKKTKFTNVSTNGHSSTTICPSCYAEVKYTKYYERVRDRALKFLTKTPEYLLVQITK